MDLENFGVRFNRNFALRNKFLNQGLEHRKGTRMTRGMRRSHPACRDQDAFCLASGRGAALPCRVCLVRTSGRRSLGEPSPCPSTGKQSRVT